VPDSTPPERKGREIVSGRVTSTPAGRAQERFGDYFTEYRSPAHRMTATAAMTLEEAERSTPESWVRAPIRAPCLCLGP